MAVFILVRYVTDTTPSDAFDVEIKNLEHQTASVTIDVSPVYSDCKVVTKSSKRK